MDGLDIKPFGKGLKAIFDNDVAELTLEVLNDNINTLSIDLIIPRKDQPRKNFSEEDLQELASSIKANGIIQPLVVQRVDSLLFEIIVGERRWRAAKLLGFQSVPVIVRKYSKREAMAVSLIENIQRQSLNPIEEGMAVQQLLQEFSMTHDEIANELGKSRSAITNLLRLLTLHDEVKELLISGKIEAGHAKALLTLDQEDQISMSTDVINKNLSVRETEMVVKNFKLPKVSSVRQAFKDNERIKSWTEILSQRLSSSISIALNERGQGKIVIKIDSTEEIEWLIKHIIVE
jgi:ParB family chromosome partitioning protein